MKTIVTNEKESTRVPFLRGILTRSLLEAGLPFEDSFKIASNVRKQLGDTATISSDELRTLVLRRLETVAGEEVLNNYNHPLTGPTRIVVTTEDGTSSAFSRGRHERYLLSSAIQEKVAEDITARIFDQLLVHGTESISTCQLGYLTYLCLKQEVGKKAARRYLHRSEFQRSGKPLLLLIGGAVGTGKSSMANEIAHRLEIVRTQSTDMLREVMRVLLPESLLPVLHRSSFEAWEALPGQDRLPADQLTETMVAEGFRNQAQLLSVPSQSVLRRAERESVSMILEGVHALPELLQDALEDPETIAVHVTLAVLKSRELKSRLRGRSSKEPKRRAKRYLEKFDAIWSLQSFLLSEADFHDGAIITNEDRGKTVHQVMMIINRELTRRFKGTPSEVFGEVVEQIGDRSNSENWQNLVPELIAR